MRRELRTLRDHSRIDIADFIAPLAQQRRDPFCEAQTVRALIFGTAVGKQLSYVSESGGSEQRIHYRVDKHIGVRMSQQPLFIGYIDAAEYQPTAFDQPMNVIALSDTEIHSEVSSLSFDLLQQRQLDGRIFVRVFKIAAAFAAELHIGVEIEKQCGRQF